ncbi:lycopene cyclase domain-containing protein [Nocardia sp. NPDC056100]|uniref:lycopene cyclase domain-containing protein n=1 Tax=Nocardia sp. NPDC056100 TaxID=3345712 RepID=UPI0035E0C3A3
MTYWQFLAVFIAPALVLVAILALRQPISPASPWRIGLLTIAVLAPVAVITTTPWDNYLITHDIWTYPPDRVLATIFAVPVEEYVFMITQTLATGLWTLYLLRRNDIEPEPEDYLGGQTRWVPVAGWATLFVATVTWARSDSLMYFTAIIVWFVPLLMLQSAVGSDVLHARRQLRFLAVGVPTVLLWCADRFAIWQHIWIINPDLTVAVRPLGLPIEEMIFFLATNLLVANSVILTTDPVLLRRLRMNSRLVAVGQR